MKIIKYLFYFVALILLIWVNVPSAIPYSFNAFGKKIQGSIPPPAITTQNEKGTFTRDFALKLGLDLQGGSSLLFDVNTSKVPVADLASALEGARDIVERRVNLFGVSEPNVRTIKSGSKYRISVELPGVNNVDEAVALIGSTAQLEFKEAASTEAKIATNTPQIVLLEKQTGLTGKDVKKATVVYSQDNGQPQVQLEFSPKGKTLFADISARNVGKQVAITIDNQIISAPVVQQPILDGTAVINGSFTVDDAKQLAIAINSGALPLPIILVDQSNIGPTLGAIEVQRSLVAGITGLVMVMVYMVIIYGRLGMVACLALIVYGLISSFIFRFIPIVMTLPGVAGFILSIGMAVDSNILIFERIKDEQQSGRTLEQSMRFGFQRAMDAIKDANATTLLVAFILFNPLNWSFLPQFGLVRGFALTLAIGVATSLFTGVFITRRLLGFFYKVKI